MSSPSSSTADAAVVGILRAPEDVERVALGPNEVVFPLAGDETGGRLSLTEFVMAPPPAPGPPPHAHEDADETVYVLDGTLEMTIGERALTGTAGAVMFVPRGIFHGLANPGPGPARMLVILTPPGYEGFWREMAALQSRSGGPPSPDTVRALQRKYHLATAGAARRLA